MARAPSSHALKVRLGNVHDHLDRFFTKESDRTRPELLWWDTPLPPIELPAARSLSECCAFQAPVEVHSFAAVAARLCSVQQSHGCHHFVARSTFQARSSGQVLKEKGHWRSDFCRNDEMMSRPPVVRVRLMRVSVVSSTATVPVMQELRVGQRNSQRTQVVGSPDVSVSINRQTLGR